MVQVPNITPTSPLPQSSEAKLLPWVPCFILMNQYTAPHSSHHEKRQYRATHNAIRSETRIIANVPYAIDRDPITVVPLLGGLLSPSLLDRTDRGLRNLTTASCLHPDPRNSISWATRKASATYRIICIPWHKLLILC